MLKVKVDLKYTKNELGYFFLAHFTLIVFFTKAPVNSKKINSKFIFFPELISDKLHTTVTYYHR